MQRRFMKICEKTDTIGGYLLFVVASVSMHREPARGIKIISGDLRWEDSHQRTAQVVGTNTCALVVNGISL